MAAILELKIRLSLVSLDMSFSKVLGSFYTKENICIMIWSEKSLRISTTIKEYIYV